MRNTLIFIMTLLAISCQTDSESPQKDNKPFIKINITDFARFENDTIGIESFIFSPIDSNTIWTFNINGPSYELKVTDSSWIKLDKKFGFYSRGLKRGNIQKDWIDEELIWICNFHRGLIAYNTRKDSYSEFRSIKPISSIYFLEDHVVVGTWKGLIIIDRKEKKVVKSEKIAEINIRKIEKINDSTLLINKMYEYSYTTDKVLNTRKINKNIYSQKEQNGFNITSYNNNVITVAKGEFLKEFKYSKYSIDNVIADEDIIWIPFRNLKNGIIKCNPSQNFIDTIQIGYDFGNYKLKNELDYLWFYNDLAILCFNKNNGETKQIPLRRKIKYLDVDSKYIYTNTWHSVEIFEKNYLLQNSRDIKISLNEEDRFKGLIDSLDIYKTKDFKASYNSFKILYSRFSNSTNTKILQQLDRSKKSLGSRLPYDFEQLCSFEEYIMDTVEDTEIKVSYYLRVIRLANYKGKLKESIKYDSILEKNYPDSRTGYHVEQMAEVAKSYEIINTINTSRLPEDIRLWRLGKAYFDLFHHVGQETEASTINMSYPFMYLDSLLKKHPQSKHTVDAEYLMLSYLEGGDNSYNLTAIEEYKLLINKYPTSKYIPEIYHKICGLYFESGTSFDDLPKYYRLALDYANKLLVEYPTYAKKQNIAELKESINRSITEVLWDLKIVSNKTNYQLDEPVEIIFRLKNIDNKSKSIQILKDNQIPNFTLSIQRFPFNKHATTYERIELAACRT